METETRAEQSTFGAGGIRKIIHIDMDAFYASVEQRDNPELRGKPVAVGGSRERGVVAAASYEARQFGVHSAMPSIIAKRKCPDLIFVKPRFDAYKTISLQIREIFAAYTPIIEPLSLDEAYLDVTENLKGISLATQIAEEIRARIRAETELTASAGVSYNKFLAKLASDHRKPDGLFVITPKTGPSFVEALPVRKFHGIGPATARKMAQLGIETGVGLKGQTLEFLQHHFGKALLLLLGGARHRRAARPRRPDTKIRRRREHLSRRSLHLRSGAGCASRNSRQGMALLRGRRHSRPHCHAQGQVRQLSDHYAQPHQSDANQDARRARTARQRVARTSLSCRQGHSAPRYLHVFTRGGTG
jgi:nucleotidyltransferase/DNA polymerase involved in DNA repair